MACAKSVALCIRLRASATTPSAFGVQKVTNSSGVSYGHPCNMFNVGAMMPWMDYTPRTLEQIELLSSGWKLEAVEKNEQA